MSCTLTSSLRSWGWTLLGSLCVGCQNTPPKLIAPPEGFQNRPTSYYTPAYGTAVPNSAPAANSGVSPVKLSPPATPNAAGALLPNRAGAALPAASLGNLPEKVASTIPDTYDVAARIPQDQQPIRVMERSAGIATANGFAPRSMVVNDGTRATMWGQSAPLQPLPFGDSQARPMAGISLAGVRGGVNDLSGSASRTNNSFSGQDGQWKTRSSYEATERR